MPDLVIDAVLGAWVGKALGVNILHSLELRSMLGLPFHRSSPPILQGYWNRVKGFPQKGSIVGT